MPSSRLPLRFVVALLLASCPRAFATTVIAPDFDSLVGQAEYVVRATVRSVSSEWRENPANPGKRYIATFVELDVKEVIKGAPPSPLVLEMVGGRVGDEELTIEGTPRFRVGEENILFVRGNGRMFSPIVALMHGAYPVRRDARTGRDQIMRCDGRPLYRAQDVSLPLGARSPVLTGSPKAQPLTAAEFATRIRSSAQTAADAHQH